MARPRGARLPGSTASEGPTAIGTTSIRWPANDGSGSSVPRSAASPQSTSLLPGCAWSIPQPLSHRIAMALWKGVRVFGLPMSTHVCGVASAFGGGGRRVKVQRDDRGGCGGNGRGAGVSATESSRIWSCMARGCYRRTGCTESREASGEAADAVWLRGVPSRSVRAESLYRRACDQATFVARATDGFQAPAAQRPAQRSA